MEIRLRQPYSFCQIGKRGNQEDARFPDTDMPQGVKPAFIVCDGVGGQEKGEVASATVAGSIGEYMSHVNLSEPFTENDFAKVLDHAYSSLNKRMNCETREMATTMTFVCFHGDGVMCAHIGDSRIYHIRPGVGILYQSDDHSLVNSMVHSGNLTPEEAIDHPQSNVITRCIGYVPRKDERASATTVQIRDLEAGDYFFLCTDGVIHQLDDNDLFEILSSDIPDKKKMDQIAEKSRSSSDNNTAYLIGIDEVISDSEEAGDMAGSIENQQGSTTVPLRTPETYVREVAPSNQTAAEKISRYIKRFFN